MQAERRAIGQRIESERRAGGRAMEERRRGTKAVDDLNSLVEPPRRTVTLGTIAPVGGFPTQRGRGVWNDARTPRTGGGIASPLTEVEGSRTYFDEALIPSTDGLVWVRMKSVKHAEFLDANGEKVAMDFKNVVPK